MRRTSAHAGPDLLIAQFSTSSELPLVLAALPERQPVPRRLSQNAALLEPGVDGDAEAMVARATARFGLVRGRAELPRAPSPPVGHVPAACRRSRAAANLSDAARPTAEGRGLVPAVQAGHARPGRVDPATGAAVGLSLDDPTVGDMPDDLAEAVLRTGGDVVVVPTERMPSDTGLAASVRH